MDAAQLLKQAANPRIPGFSAGDTVRVNFRIREGERERIQVFQGVVIRVHNGKGPAASFTVRRITAGIGIERVFPLYSPLVESLEVTRYGNVRRAKLYYLRGLQGRAARIKELNPVQRRKAQEEAAAAEAELAEQIAQAVADTETLEVEEPIEDLEEQPEEQTEFAPPPEASDESEEETAEETADVPEASVEEPAEEAPAEEEPADEPAGEPQAEEPEEKPEEE
jgi:large subunit ribosomal protein L19